VKGPRLRIGFLDNSKANADHLLRMLAERVRGACAVENIVALRKSSVAIPASAQVLEQLTSECDLVFSAMAD
jgi:hypothetical protein